MTLRDSAARRLIRDALGETLFVEAGAGSGKTTSLVERVVAIVLTDGVPLRNVAAVTFTEKAAAELRDRLRVAFSHVVAAAGSEAVLAEAALDDLNSAAIGTLHAFAQRLLTEHPIEAGLPPLIEVQDEVASGVNVDARWATLRAELLDDETLTETLLLAMAAGMRLEDLRSMAGTFNHNWDLIADRVLHHRVAAPPPLDVSALVADARRVVALAGHCTDDDDKLLARLADLAGWAQSLADAPDDAGRLTALGEALGGAWRIGRAPNWTGYGIDRLRGECRAVAEAATRLRDTVLDVALRRLAHRIGRATLKDAEVRRAEGRLEFHDMLVMARELVRHPVHGAQVRATLQQRYRRLLLDEFQDTDPIQIELAVRIAGGAAATQRDWENVPVPGGSLFVVGDPKQSIYRFRRADIATYLHAQHRIGREVVLDTNFRTGGPILDWINTVFGRLIVAEPDSQPAYRPLRAHRPAAPKGPPVLALGADEHTDSPDAATLREREAADVVDAVRTAICERWQVAAADGAWRDIELRDIAVLVPARTSLPQLETALDAAGIGYHPGASSLVYRSREVRDLLVAARAADDPSDELALVTALRSPLFGCGDDDLWTWRQARGRFSLFSTCPLPDSHPVAQGIAYLRRLHNDRTWLAPSEVLGRLVDDRRMFELAADEPLGRDVWRRLRYVIDQARAWSDVEHGGLRGYLAWAARQGSETASVAEAALPETDAATLKIMTVHSAKGLEFPMVIVSGLGSRLTRNRGGVEVLWPRSGGCELKLGSALRTADFDIAKPVDEQMDYHERLRLLYVACTRARDHLVVSLHRKARAGSSSGSPTSAELLASATAAVPSLVVAPDLGSVRPAAAVVAEPPPFDAWSFAIGTARAAAARAPAVSASGFEGSLAGVAAAPLSPLGDPADPGLAKNPRDLELPPWHKGRYGTAIGRAVHGVLQTVELATGLGFADAVAAQALVEGVVPAASLVSELASAALSSPLVRRAAARPHWRESYVATVIGDRVLEGIVDLLYRDDDGLVIVDYKTDAVPSAALPARVDYYRPQMAAYAAAVEAAVGAPVARCVLLFLSPAGADAIVVPQIPEAVIEIREAVLA
jgi:ATP-dependent exoDNAse (exonuclease V) beta subunit